MDELWRAKNTKYEVCKDEKIVVYDNFKEKLFACYIRFQVENSLIAGADDPTKQPIGILKFESRFVLGCT